MSSSSQGGSIRSIRPALWRASCSLAAFWRKRYNRRTVRTLQFAAYGLLLLTAPPVTLAAICETFSYPPTCGNWGPVMTGITYSCCSTILGGCCQWTCTQLYCKYDPGNTGYQATSTGTFRSSYTCSNPPGTCSRVGA